MKKRSLIVFRVDGGRYLGMGHLFKTSILISRLRKLRKDLSFLIFIKEEKEGIVWLKKQKLPFKVIPSEVRRAEEPGWMCRKILKGTNALFVLDILDVAKPYVLQLQKNGYSVMTLENQGTSVEAADVTVNAIVEGVTSGISKKGKTLRLKGADFRIFHPDYEKFRKETGSNGKVVLVTFGGGTDKGFAGKFLGKAMKACPDTQFQLITGPAQRVRCQGAGSLKVLGPQKSLAAFFKRASVAVIAGGGTLYESALMGVPAVAFSKKRHQEKNIKMFVKNGTALYAGEMAEKNIKKGVGLLTELLKSKKKQNNMAKNGTRLVDGKGIERVSSIALHLLKEKSNGVI